MQTANACGATVLNEDLMERVETIVAGCADPGAGIDGAVSMQLAQSHNSKQNCLRFVFQDRVVSIDVAADLSFGDVACTLREQIPGRYGEPISIDCIRRNRISAATGR